MVPSAPDLSWLDELNPPQRAAVTHGDGPLLVVAGAGSGKTRTLAARVAWLAARGVDPERILLLTFTRRAAEEMLKRAAGLMRQNAGFAGRTWGGTFHAAANRLLRLYAAPSGLNPAFTVMDQSDAEDLMDVVRHELGLAARDKRFPRKSTCLAVYSRCVNGADDLARVLRRDFPWCADWGDELKRLFGAYVERKQARDVLDYDDLLLYWRHLLDDADLARRMGGRFDHILVDEYQDTNVLQAAILRGLRRENPNLMAVGDDAQSIYRFRAATVKNMLEFPQHFPGATIVTLDQNYRSTAPILEATNRLIGVAKARYAKNLWSARTGGEKPGLVLCRDEARQDEYVIRTILAHYEQGIPLQRQAVLFRTAHHADSLELELTRRNIPYRKYGGLKYLEAAHVKDLLAILRVAENPRDEPAWFRVLQLLDGVGPTTAAAAWKHLGANGYDPRALRTFRAPPAAAAGVEALAAALDDLSAFDGGEPAAQVERVRRFYDPVCARKYDNPEPRQRDLACLEQAAAAHRSRRTFLSELILDPPASTGDWAGAPLKDEDWLTLSTIHSAKGCEWDVVVLIHAADGNLPSDMATGDDEEIEEERRLAYVAMTRARDFLYVTWPQRYFHRTSRFTDRHSYAQLCRFFTPDVVAAMEKSAWPDTPDPEEAPAAPGRLVTDVRASLRGMWK